MTRWFQSSSSGAASHLAGCALMAAATWASGDSTARRQARGTHMGVPPSDIVTLISSGSGTTLKFLRANADGTTDASEFVVPTGQQLVVTDVDWAGGTKDIRTKASVRLWVENKASPSSRRLGFLRHEYLENAVNTTVSGGVGSSLAGGSSSGVLAGFCVASSARLTADIWDGVPTTTFGSITWTPTIVVRGNLTADE
jgi:hypothetical protein